MRTLILVSCILCSLQRGDCESIDLQTAWDRVVCYAPSLAVADAEVSILEGIAHQVSIMFNPVIEVESENLGVSHPSDDVEPPQTTFSLAQTLELGGKRKARFSLASAESCIAFWEAQMQREDAFLALKSAFIEVAALQEKLQLAKKREEIASQILQSVRKQIHNGKRSPLQEKRAKMGLMAETLLVREVSSAFEQAKTHLASMWGSACPDFDCVDFELFEFGTLPCETVFLEGFYQTSDFTRAQQLVASAAQNLTLQKANGIPDLTLMVGYRVYHDSHEGGWVVGAEMPLPFFNRNQGSVRSARSGLCQAEYQLEEIVRERRERILLTYERLQNSYEEIELLYRQVLTEAKETVELTTEGYQRGKFAYIELLDAQKTLFELEERYIDVLCEYHQNRAHLARLSGMEL